MACMPLSTRPSSEITTASPAISAPRQAQRSQWGRLARVSSPAATSATPAAGQIQLMLRPKRENRPMTI